MAKDLAIDLIGYASAAVLGQRLDERHRPSTLSAESRTLIVLGKRTLRGVLWARHLPSKQLAGGRLTDHLREALAWMARFDVADVPGRGQPGTGEINFTHLRRVLESEGYDGVVSFEVDPVGGDSDAAVMACRRVFGF